MPSQNKNAFNPLLGKIIYYKYRYILCVEVPYKTELKQPSITTETLGKSKHKWGRLSLKFVFETRWGWCYSILVYVPVSGIKLRDERLISNGKVQHTQYVSRLWLLNKNFFCDVYIIYFIRILVLNYLFIVYTYS